MIFTKGNEIYEIGTSASCNWELLDNADKDDIWVHLDGFPSCYVICKWNNNMSFPTKAKKKKYIQKRAKEAGKICYIRSQNKIPDDLKEIDIIYIKCKYVKKGAIVGQAELIKEPTTLTIEIN